MRFAASGLIVIPTRLVGPNGDRSIRLGLDTGSTATLIHAPILIKLGYDLEKTARHIGVTTATDMQYVPVVDADEISALGVKRRRFRVVGHTLPPTATIDGVLGLDFLHSCRLVVDFVERWLSLEQSL